MSRFVAIPAAIYLAIYDISRRLAHRDISAWHEAVYMRVVDALISCGTSVKTDGNLNRADDIAAAATAASARVAPQLVPGRRSARFRWWPLEVGTAWHRRRHSNVAA